MKNLAKIILLSAISTCAGVWAYQNLPSHYFIEEYYNVQNLDPHNEKDTEVLRQNVQQLMQKTIPARYRLNPDHFQCFKIISEAVFFCSADSSRKKEAEYIRKLLQETIPNEIGWIPYDEAQMKAERLNEEIKSNKQILAQNSRELEKLMNQKKKNSSSEKKFNKVNDLYKKSKNLYEKKSEILQTMISNIGNTELKESYQLKFEENQSDLAQLQNEYDTFRSKNESFVKIAEKRDRLQDEVSRLEAQIDQQQKDLNFVDQTLANPNSAGRVANVEELQLIPDPAHQKFELQYRQSNLIWFALVLFLILSNFVLRIRTVDLIPFEDATRTEALIK